MAFLPLMGYTPNPEATERFVESLPFPTLASAGPGLADEQRETLLYPALLSVAPDWKRGAQGIGSCVGWGWSLSCDILAACDIVVRGESESYGGRVLEASVYAFSRVEARGGRPAGMSDGSYGAAAAKAVTQFGTLHYGIDYGGQTFGEYSANREKTWGNTGVPNELEPFAVKHRVATTTLVASFKEAGVAIQNGYPVAVCSGQGFGMTRDADGFCRASGSWGHCMMFAGVRYGSRPGLLCVNSWGASNSGKHYPETMPERFKECSFWVDADVCDRMLSGRDSFAIAGYEGFAPRRLPDWLGGVL
ncbi:MAG: hypothetical protein WCG15_00105 [Actinomycetes bacterium]